MIEEKRMGIASYNANTYHAIFDMVAEQTGLVYYANIGGLFGTFGGYHVSVTRTANNTPVIQVSARCNGMLPTPDFAKHVAKQVKGGKKAYIRNNKICIEAYGFTNKACADRVVACINVLTEQLKANGFVDTCEYCGSEVTDIAAFGVEGNVSHLCTNCGLNTEKIETQQILAAEAVQENVFMGILGALLGAIVGSLIIYLIGLAGYVAGIGGVALAVASLLGYEKLGKKLSTRGIIITSIIMIIAVFVTMKMEWSIELYKEFTKEYDDISFFAVYKVLLPMLKEFGALADFIKDLAVLYLFTALGAVPTIRKKLSERKHIEDVVNRSGTAA
jgi:hypothetical protein